MTATLFALNDIKCGPRTATRMLEEKALDRMVVARLRVDASGRAPAQTEVHAPRNGGCDEQNALCFDCSRLPVTAPMVLPSILSSELRAELHEVSDDVQAFVTRRMLATEGRDTNQCGTGLAYLASPDAIAYHQRDKYA